MIIITIILIIKIVKTPISHEKYSDYGTNDNYFEPAPVLPTVDEAIFESPGNFYWLQNSCMTPNESRMFFYISRALDNLLDPKIRKYYYLFPQVSLYSFIGISDKYLSNKELFAARKNLLKKNADFVICHCTWKSLKSANNADTRSGFYAYEPVLWIELDGSSHVSGQKYGWNNFFDQQKRDTFKNRLAEQLNLPLLRYVIEKDYLTYEDGKQIETKLAEALHIANATDNKES